MIMCIHQRKGMTYFDVPLQQSLLDIVCNNVNMVPPYLQMNI